MKNMKDATLEEWNDIKYVVGLKSREGGGFNTDLIQKIYNTFVANIKICRTCPSQLASIMSIIKLRHDLNYEYLENKFSGTLCKKCNNLFEPNHHFTKYCDECKNK